MHSVITLQPGVDPKRQVLFDPSVVTAQPTESVPSAPGVPWMPVPLNETGLEYLKDLEMIQINQTKESVGILTTWQLENKYVLRNGNGEQCYYGLERSDECERDCCSSYREFKIHIVDCFTKEVLSIQRLSRCNGIGLGALFRCCQQICTIDSPSLGPLGSIRQSFRCSNSKFEVLDSDGRLVFQITDSGCGWGETEFMIKDSNTVIGRITKSGIKSYTVYFPRDLDVKLKGVLLGATFLIGIMIFE